MLNFSFKRISSRPVTKESDRVTLMKKAFCIEFGNLSESETLIISIDEAKYSRTTPINYSWDVERNKSLWKTSRSMSPLQLKQQSHLKEIGCQQ